MDNKHFKIPENVTNVDQMKGFAEAMTAFFQQLLILNKSMETMAKDTKDIKDYFTLANGFQRDSKIMQEDVVEKLMEKMKEDKEDLKSKIDSSTELLTKTLFNKILALVLSSLGTLGIIFYSIQNFLLKSSVQSIIDEVLKHTVK